MNIDVEFYIKHLLYDSHIIYVEANANTLFIL